MSVALLLVTHENIGNNMLAITRAILNEDLENSVCLEVPMDAATGSIHQKAAEAINNLETDEGVLIITDSFGSTPYNIANALLTDNNRALVSGLNLPMLLRIMNYRALPMEELTRIAIEGGNKGIQVRNMNNGTKPGS